MIDVAEPEFRQWIAALKDTGNVVADPAALYAAIGDGRSRTAVRSRSERVRAGRRRGSAARARGAMNRSRLHRRWSKSWRPLRRPDEFALPEILLPEIETPPSQPSRSSRDRTWSSCRSWAAQEPNRRRRPPTGSTRGRRRRQRRDHRRGAEPRSRGPCRNASRRRGAATPAVAIMIGDVTLSPDLYAVLVDEADVHLATLEHELSVLQFDPSAVAIRRRWCARATRCAASTVRAGCRSSR